nr:uncharacterized protein LOC109150426 [Ipomoea batatas]
MNTSIEIESSKRLRDVVPSRMRREIDIHVSCNEVLKVKPKTIIYTLQGGNEENFDLSYGAAPTEDERGTISGEGAEQRQQLSSKSSSNGGLRRVAEQCQQSSGDLPAAAVSSERTLATISRLRQQQFATTRREGFGGPGWRAPTATETLVVQVETPLSGGINDTALRWLFYLADFPFTYFFLKRLKPRKRAPVDFEANSAASKVELER